MKSLQNVLNEFVLNQELDYTITASALTQAKQKLRYTAFVELNDDTVSFYYEDDNIKRIRGFRCLGMDGSRVVLPPSKEIREEYGSISINNGRDANLGEYTYGLFQCCYDLLNHIAVKSSLTHSKSYEVDLAIEMLPSFNEKDLVIFDRGYLSFKLLAELERAKCEYVIRCPKNSFNAVKSHFKKLGSWSKVVTLKAPTEQIAKLKAQGIATEVKVRLVRVILSTGEAEVLVSSVMDTESEKYSREFFKMIYGLRWGVETFFFILKSRLGLENFTGKSVESIKQDFWSTIFISNAETILTEDEQEKLNHPQNGQLKRKVNKAVSFNVIKNMAFEIFYEKDGDLAMEKFTKLFSMNPVVQREEREVPRGKFSSLKSLNFNKRLKKQVF